MKAISADLLDDVVGAYDQTKTTIQGRAISKTVNSNTVLGPPLNKFVDTVADTAGTTIPVLSYLTSNGRLFSIGAEAGGVSFMSLHTIDMTTLAKTFVGQIRFTLPDNAATTHTFRSIKVLDTGTTNWKIFITTTGTVAINGGTFLGNKIDMADFISVGSTLIPFATGNDQKAIYFLQDSANIGVGQLQIASAGSAVDVTNNKLFVHNGIAATHQYYVYDTATAPTYSTVAVSVSVASPGIVTDTGHAFVANTPVVFTAGTLPTGLVVGTVYYVRNPVAGVSYELSATTGGASINTTGSPSAGAFIGRAFGTSSNLFLYKTGNLPALTGTLLLNDSEDYALPGHTANSGFDCIFFSTNSTLYLGRMSDLTSGVVVWPSLVSANLLGTSNQITAPTASQATWSNALDKAIFITNVNILVMKEMVNNVIYKIFGGVDNTYRETFPESDAQGLEFLTSTSLDVEDGIMALTTSTTGIRGVILSDLRSDVSFEYSYIVTKVLDSPNSVYKFLTTYEEIESLSSSLTIQYRTSGFGSISGGWTTLNYLTDLSYIPGATNIQFKILFNTLSLGRSAPAQVNELILGLESNLEISDYWQFSGDYSDNTSPSRTAFRLKKVYASSVPTLYYRAYDLSDALLVNHNTVTNAANFEYSTDDGMTWLPLGTIPNTVGTMIRYTFTSPPSVTIQPSIKEN